MIIEVIDAGPKKTKQIVAAVSYFLSQLISKKKRQDIRVKIHLTTTILDPKSPTPAVADVCQMSDGSFLMRVYKRQKFREFLQCLAHECVHIKQMICDGFDMRTDTITVFKNRIYNPSQTPYESSPWEIEAKAKDLPLADKYLDSLY